MTNYRIITLDDADTTIYRCEDNKLTTDDYEQIYLKFTNVECSLTPYTQLSLALEQEEVNKLYAFTSQVEKAAKLECNPLVSEYHSPKTNKTYYNFKPKIPKQPIAIYNPKQDVKLVVGVKYNATVLVHVSSVYQREGKNYIICQVKEVAIQPPKPPVKLI